MSDSEGEHKSKHSSYGGGEKKSKDDVFKERASKLDDDVRRLETKTFISKIPKIYFVVGAVPLIVLPVLYFGAPGFVRTSEVDEKGNYKFDKGKWLAWSLFIITAIEFCLYVYYTKMTK